MWCDVEDPWDAPGQLGLPLGRWDTFWSMLVLWSMPGLSRGRGGCLPWGCMSPWS